LGNIFKKHTYVGVLFLSLAGIVSCEKDFTDIGTGVISNTEFSTGEVVLEVEIIQNNITSVRADNISLNTLEEYWLGVYNTPYAEKIEAGFVSQLSLPSDLVVSEASINDTTTVYSLDKVILKIPYTSVFVSKEADGKSKFRLDSILGNPSIPTELEVYRNGTFINRLDPADPSKENSFSSDFVYQEEELLTAAGFTFKPSAVDTVFYFNRADRSIALNSATSIQDTLKLSTASSLAAPFLAIPLDLDEMKRLFWDKFEDPDFSSSAEFQTYFKGIILKTKGADGALVPINLASESTPSIDFFYAKTILKGSDVIENTTSTYSFPLSNARSSTYTMSPASMSVPNENFIIQGTAGASATVKILGVNLLELENSNPLDPILEYKDKDVNNDGFLDLEELASLTDEINQEGLLVNDALLTFYVNTVASPDADILPQKLLIYKNIEMNGRVTPTHIEDSYTEFASFGGGLLLDEDGTPERYNFKVTDYISNLLDGTNDDLPTLELKVFNKVTDLPVNGSGALDVSVKTYNWNPRAVLLLNGDNTTNGIKKAQLKISYTEKKK
jgi:hypothetical protein|tara:strand:+ start:833 stop:2509 length:1677 start_codon:yes stop_codon:yes gene_type:complete